MKISNISLFNIKTSNQKIKNNQSQIKNYNETSASYSQIPYIPFCGGYSVNLKETFAQLKDEQYPKDIKEAVAQALQDKDSQNKTLYDIHFEKYKGIMDCYSLEELKEKYPEFKDVISVNDVETTPESFIGKYKNNELDLFSQDEDLTLQLIKLYWGQGFSLSDLSNYIAKNNENNQGINLYYAMTKKLNIPMINRRYALVLKLSNKEYNEQFTAQMSIKSKEAKEEKLQKAQGEAVVIPKGELSKAHKEHISQGLKKYYQEHPEKIYEMSQRQKQFFEENPDKIEELSEVALFAWHNTKEGASVLKGLNRFFKKQNSEITPKELSNPLQITGKKRTLLELFWQKNAWAKAQFSIAMKKAWANQKEKTTNSQKTNIKDFFKTIEGKKMRFSFMPTKIRNEVIAWAKEKGYDTTNLIINEGIIYRKEEDKDHEEIIDENIKMAEKIVNEFLIENEKIANANVTCLLKTIIKLQSALKTQENLPSSLKGHKDKINVMDYKLDFLCYIYDLPTPDNTNIANVTKEHSAQEIEEMYSSLMEQAIALGCYDFGEYMDKLLDKSYMELKAHGKI